MRLLFKWLFSKVKPIYMIPILIVIGFLSVYVFPSFISSNILIKAEFPLDKSPNPEATKHFVKAMESKVKVKNLHRFVDYDSSLMKPFLDDVYAEYEKGKSLLPKNSAEDVYWYVILFRGIHGIGGYPDKKDMSVAYEKMYSKQEYKKHYEEILERIRRLAEDDFTYDVPRITQYKFEFMDNLVAEMKGILFDFTEEDKKNFLNEKYLKDLNKVYNYYSKFSEKYLPLSKRQNESLVRVLYQKTKLLTYALAFKIYQTKRANCENKNYEKLIQNIKTLKQMSLDPQFKNQTFYYRTMFNNLWAHRIISIGEKHCSHLKKDAKEVLKYFTSTLKNTERKK